MTKGISMSEYYLTRNDDKKFAIPEQKKFPLPDANHVRSAIKFFNYVEPRYEKQLARAILRRAKEYGVDISEMNIGDNNRFKKYLPNELKHYGIAGQKWGVRNGPPYPLGENNYSKAEKDAAKKFHLTDKQKKALKIGAAIVGAGLAVYGVYKLGSSGVLNELISKGKALTDKRLAGFPMMNDGPNGYPSFMDKINPSNNRMNCGPTALATDLEFSGKHYEARPRRFGVKFRKMLNECYGPRIVKNNLHYANTKTKGELSKELIEKYPPNSHGLISFYKMKSLFKDKTYNHGFNWYIDENSIAHFCDTHNKHGDCSHYFNVLTTDSYIRYIRTDDLQLNTEKAKRYLKERK